MEMSVSSARGDHRGPMWTVIPYSTYDCMRAAAGCLNSSSRLSSVFRCLEARNDKRSGVLRISMVVALTISARSSVGVTAGGE